MTQRYPIWLCIRHRDYDNSHILTIGNDQEATVAECHLDPTGVDFQMSLDELVGIANKAFSAPATLAEWQTHQGGWRYSLFM